MGNTILEAHAVITADDKTGAAFSAIEKKMVALAKTSKSVSDMSKVMKGATDQSASRKLIDGLTSYTRSADAARLASQRMVEGMSTIGLQAERAAGKIDNVSGRILRMSRVMQAAGNVARTLGPVAGAAAGAGILHFTKDAVHGGAEIQSERVKMSVAGIPGVERTAAEMQSAALAHQFPNEKRSGIMETYKETRSVLLHPEETPAMMPSIIAAKSSMDAIDNTGRLSEGLAFAIKGAELLGKAQDPEKFKAYLDSFIRAQQVMGKTITPETMFGLAKYLKSSGPTLSDRFLSTTALSLSQELGGKTTGVGIDQFVKQMSGDFHGSHAALKEFARAKLVDEKDILYANNGEAKGLKPGRHVKYWREATSDPDKFVWDRLMPMLDHIGVKGPDDQIAWARRAFPNTNVASAVAKLITQKESFENHAKLLGEPAGLPGGQQMLQEDPFAAFASFKTSFENLGATLTSPIMQKAAESLNAMASAISGFGESVAKWQKDNPDLAQQAAVGTVGVGVLGGSALVYQVVGALKGGFGLTAASGELTAAAGALETAAARLGSAPGAVPGGSGGPGGIVEQKSTGTSFWTPFAQLFAYEAGKFAIDTAFSVLPKPAYPEGYDPRKEENKSVIDRGGEVVDAITNWFRGAAPPSPSAANFPPIMQQSSDLPIMAQVPPALQHIDTAPLDNLQQRSHEVSDQLVTDLNQTLKPNVDLSGIDLLIAKLSEARTAMESLNGTAQSASRRSPPRQNNTGRSMPEAEP